MGIARHLRLTDIPIASRSKGWWIYVTIGSPGDGRQEHLRRTFSSRGSGQALRAEKLHSAEFSTAVFSEFVAETDGFLSQTCNAFVAQSIGFTKAESCSVSARKLISEVKGGTKSGRSDPQPLPTEWDLNDPKVQEYLDIRPGPAGA